MLNYQLTTVWKSWTIKFPKELMQYKFTLVDEAAEQINIDQLVWNKHNKERILLGDWK